MTTSIELPCYKSVIHEITKQKEGRKKVERDFVG